MVDLLELSFPGDRHVTRVHGGDINDTFLVRHRGQDFFIKYNNASFAQEMFETEKNGLETMAEVIPGNVPKVIDQINGKSGSILILEYIVTGSKSDADQSDLGRMVAMLHQKSDQYFGLSIDNYIGSLKQYNGRYDTFYSFYIERRILPQVRLAIDNKLLDSLYIHKSEKLASVVYSEFPNERPALIHGDLWGGNYLRSSEGIFYLIDPSISYAHREMDLAMSLLFGGYNDSFYFAYNETYPLVKGWKTRIGILQLYYLLVHLNLFGISYKSSVSDIFDRWT